MPFTAEDEALYWATHSRWPQLDGLAGFTLLSERSPLMPRHSSPLPPNPLALLDSVVRSIGKAAIRAHLDYTSQGPTLTTASDMKLDNLRLRLPVAKKRRKKRADAGKPRVKAAPTKPAPKPKPRVQRAKPRVDPLTQVTEVEEGA